VADRQTDGVKSVLNGKKRGWLKAATFLHSTFGRNKNDRIQDWDETNDLEMLPKPAKARGPIDDSCSCAYEQSAFLSLRSSRARNGLRKY